MHVALLTASDALRYRRLMLQAYELAADAFTSTAEERAAEPDSWWVGRIADPQGTTAAFGAFEGPELVGTVALEFSSKPKTKHRALLIGMYVTPSSRGNGAGRALLEAALRYAEARTGTLVVALTVTQGNEAAIGLYQAAGFEPFGVEPLALRTAGGFKAKVHMWRRIASAAAADDQARARQIPNAACRDQPSSDPDPGMPCRHLRAGAGVGYRQRQPFEERPMTPFAVARIDHVVLRVLSLARSTEFYVEVLGCKLVRSRDDLGLVHLRAGRSMIDLVDVNGRLGLAGGPAPSANARNLDHVCLRVEPFDEPEIVAHLARFGVTPHGPAAPRFGAEGQGPSLYISDPDLNTIELKGPVETGAAAGG